MNIGDAEDPSLELKELVEPPQIGIMLTYLSTIFNRLKTGVTRLGKILQLWKNLKSS